MVEFVKRPMPVLKMEDRQIRGLATDKVLTQVYFIKHMPRNTKSIFVCLLSPQV